MSLSPVIQVNDEKCINCHQCISVCPIKFCMDGSGDVIKIDSQLCIGCGKCIDACTHQARLRMDDFELFLERSRNEKMVAIVAPAVASTFPDHYLRLNTYLKKAGVEAIFDVSFGAELTIKSYLHHVEKNNPPMVIAQPCPAIVNYIEIYQPQLLPYLAPADSPMLHTMKMIKEFYPQYKNHSVGVISPCLAKKREFQQTGLGDYNITLAGLQEYFSTHGVDLSRYEETPYDSPAPERAVLFSTPGGLFSTLQRESEAAASRTRKIEGPDLVYPYLENLKNSLEEGIQPLLIDCLNCEKGCNGGTGTLLQEASQDRLEYAVKQRAAKMIKTNKKKIQRAVKKYWKPELYNRSYQDRSHLNSLKTPSEEAKEDIFRSMHKYTKEDVYNCASCGYGSCDKMATAIYNGLNKPENCHHYQIDLIEKGRENIRRITDALTQKVDQSFEEISQVNVMVERLLEGTASQSAAIEESSAAIEEMIASIQNVNGLLQDRRGMVSRLQDRAADKMGSMRDTVSSIDKVVGSVDKVQGFNDTINNIAANTNLLAMNAAIEAAHAGDRGRGFSVVAAEIRKLAEESAKNAHNIADDLKKIVTDIDSSRKISSQTSMEIAEIIEGFSSIASSVEELTMNMMQMSAGTDQIQSALSEMVQTSHEVTDFGREMDEVLEKMMTVFTELHSLSKEGSKTLTE